MNFHRMKTQQGCCLTEFLRIKILTFVLKKITFFEDFYALKHVFFKFGMYLMCVSSMGQKFEKMTIFERFEKKLSKK